MSPRLSGVVRVLCLFLPCLALAQGEQICAPDEYEPCKMANGCGGLKKCNRTGTGYSLCMVDPDSVFGAACTGCGGQTGRKVCNLLGNYTGCQVAEYESCNNCDDNGDGFKDNAQLVGQHNTLVNLCNPNGCATGGRKTCTDGVWSACSGCGGTAPCTGCQNKSGTALCDSSCGKSACNVGAETCNNCDDDADGYEDNAPGVASHDSLRLTCGPNVCGQTGTQACTQGVPTGACQFAESCNNCDDDSDGVVDEGLSCQPCDL